MESNLTSYTDTGTFCIYFGCDPADLDYCTRLVYKELKRLRDARMTSSQLAAAKKQLIGQIGVASDNNENNALGMGKTFLHYDKCETSEAVFHRIEQLTFGSAVRGGERDVCRGLSFDAHLSVIDSCFASSRCMLNWHPQYCWL